MSEITGAYRRQDQALRLTFSYADGSLSLVDQRLTAATPLPSHPIPKEPEKQAGFWVELNGRDGKPLYRRNLNAPIQRRVEQPNDDGSFTNVDIEKPRGSFSLLVPNLDAAAEVAVWSSPLKPGAEATAAEPLGRFRLGRKPTDDPNRGGDVQ